MSGTASNSRQLRVLIADDDRDAVLSLMLLMRDEGHEVRGAYSGTEVVQKVRDFGPDALLLDIGMPHRSGYEVACELRERYGSAKPLLIAITGWKNATDKMLAQLAGFDHHLGKPYDPRALLVLLEPLKPRFPLT